MENTQIDPRKYHILIIEDEEDILELIQFNLDRFGFRTSTASTGERGLKIARSEHPDLILLDIMLPGIDGLDVCRLLKGDKDTASIPVVMLTAKVGEADIIQGLEIGADDYVKKPFSPKELIARIKAVLRRHTAFDEDGKSEVIFKNIKLDPGHREVFVDGNLIDLTYTEFEILFLMIRHPGLVFSRSKIVDEVRGENYPVTDRSVDFQIVGLRKKMGDTGKYIKTVRGVGYRLKEE